MTRTSAELSVGIRPQHPVCVERRVVVVEQQPLRAL